MRQVDARSALPQADRAHIASTLGDALARLHDPTFEFWATYDLRAEQFVELPGSWAEHVATEVEDYLAKSRSQSLATTIDDVRWVAEVLSRNRDALEGPFRPRART